MAAVAVPPVDADGQPMLIATAKPLARKRRERAAR
jgi:hypothetical protein